MEIARKLKALDRIYAVYDEFIRVQETACKMHCHQCCTTHVTLTTLEAYKICETLPPGEREKLFRRVREASGLKRFQPAVTTNALAELCAEDDDLPAENEASAKGKCPLLAEDLCSIYALRPFNCRCFISRTPCGEKGFADVDEVALAVNTLFLQTVEHVDADGCSGNLLDVLEVLASEEKRTACAGGTLHCTGNGLIANRPMKVLMLPPGQRKRIEPILSKLRAIRI
ncbi:MAG: YkgJ family cysteine cluster protein [Deltaproteobacteria bacterium]|nr:YkgJ family cysteine cluster protein [Deltaproteobacteria bacterium]